MILAGIEAGGTKFVCGVGTGPHDLIREEFSTTSPAETTARAAAFLNRYKPEALGIGCFGPLDLRAGRITTTPKLDWQGFDIVEAFRYATGIERIAFDTDVNAAAMGEYTWGAAHQVDVLLYLTVGTGIGGGGMCGGRLMHGLVHPEMGHMRIPHDLQVDPFAGSCYAHGDCLEGLASGYAIESRWGQPGEDLPAGHPAWELEASYLALALVNLICTLSPQKIILGGGVMNKISFALLRDRVARELNGYVQAPEIVPPALGNNAGVLGALALAR